MQAAPLLRRSEILPSSVGEGSPLPLSRSEIWRCQVKFALRASEIFSPRRECESFIVLRNMPRPTEEILTFEAKPRTFHICPTHSYKLRGTGLVPEDKDDRKNQGQERREEKPGRK